MSKYVVQIDDPRTLKTTVLISSKSLAIAIAAVEANGTAKAYVRHEPSGLQRYIYRGRVVWLDDHGVEHSQPHDPASR